MPVYIQVDEDRADEKIKIMLSEFQALTLVQDVLHRLKFRNRDGNGQLLDERIDIVFPVAKIRNS